MKKFFTLYFLTLSMVIFLSGSIKAQYVVYFTEGFEAGGGTTISTVSPTNPGPIDYWGVGSNSAGEWYLHGVYRTTGTGCAAPYGVSHIRFKNNTGTPAPFVDSPFIVTPLVSLGIKQLHFTRSRASRYFYIYTTTDTGAVTNGPANIPTRWTFIDSLKGWTNVVNPCTDTMINVNQPLAKRLKIVGRLGTDSDIDSVWLVSTVLPVKFSGISANYANGMVKVLWNNETELNTMKYEVERSVDARNFAAIGSVNATNIRQYSLFDYSPSAGVNYYRIRGVDRDGSSTYSTVVKINTRKGTKDIAVMPNPVKGGRMNLQLTEFESGTYNLSIYSNAGQQIYSTKIVSEGGSSARSIILPASVTRGMYKIQVEGANTKIAKSVFVD